MSRHLRRILPPAPVADHPPGTWGAIDDGIVTGRISQRVKTCDVCGRAGCCVKVEAYSGVDADWRATIIWLGRYTKGVLATQEAAVFLGISCGCLQKLHRQVAHIRDKKAARERRPDPTGAWK